MKLVVAVIKPQMLDKVREALLALHIEGMTVSDVKGYGRQKGHSEVYRGAEYTVDFVPKTKIEVAIADERLSDVLAAIKSAAETGRIGDGKVFVLNLEEAVRVRTGESGADAL